MACPSFSTHRWSLGLLRIGRKSLRSHRCCARDLAPRHRSPSLPTSAQRGRSCLCERPSTRPHVLQEWVLGSRTCTSRSCRRKPAPGQDARSKREPSCPFAAGAFLFASGIYFHTSQWLAASSSHLASSCLLLRGSSTCVSLVSYRSN